MSTSRYSIQQVAQHLSCSERSVRSYIRQGLLSQIRVSNERKRYYDPAEVEELRLSLSKGRTAVRAEEVSALRGQVKRIQATLDVVLRVLDAKDDPLQVTPEYGQQLLVLCLQQLQRGNWSPSEMEMWSEVFLRLNEDDLGVIARATEDTRPWLPFLRLATAMSASLPTHEEYRQSLDLQSLHQKVAEGRRRLRTAAVIFAESRGAAEPDLVKFAEYQVPSSLGDLMKVMLRKKRG